LTTYSQTLTFLDFEMVEKWLNCNGTYQKL